MIVHRALATLAAWAGLVVPSFGSDSIVSLSRTTSGDPVVYLLTTKPGTPAYAVILMSSGNSQPRLGQRRWSV